MTEREEEGGASGVRELEHTADVGFRVRASDPEELFALAARGLVEALGYGRRDAARVTGELPSTEGTGAGPVGPPGTGGEPARGRAAGETEAEEVRLESSDLERLLVAWLREILFRCQTGGRTPVVEVEEVAAPETGPAPRRPEGAGTDAGPRRGETSATARARLRGRIRWVTPESEPEREVKGVTYHGLRVERRDDGGWHARVVLDV